jgi:AcrR family transcriptional regulator
MVPPIRRSGTAVNRSRLDLVAEGVKRKYQSAVREAAAAETADRIRRAAVELFVAQGFAATTLKQVAERAGVGERTVYDAFGNKHRLLGHTIGMLAMGDEDRTPIAQRAELREARDREDPREAVATTMANQAALMERAGDLILVGEEAGRVDPVARASSRTGYELARQIFVLLAERLEARGELRKGVDATTAADAMFALASPQYFEILRRRRRWSAARYRDWVVEAAQLQVLPPQSNADGNTSR